MARMLPQPGGTSWLTFRVTDVEIRICQFRIASHYNEVTRDPKYSVSSFRSPVLSAGDEFIIMAINCLWWLHKGNLPLCTPLIPSSLVMSMEMTSSDYSSLILATTFLMA